MARRKKSTKNNTKAPRDVSAPKEVSKLRLSSAFKIFIASLRHLKAHWRIFGGIALIYILLTLLLVTGFSAGINVAELRQAIESAVQGSANNLTTGVTLYGVLLGTAGQTAGEAAGVYQALLLIIISLALIWALRQTYAGKTVRLKEAFYRSTFPLIPFLGVLAVISLQLLPLALANFLAGLVFAGLAVTTIEKVLWLLLIFLLVLWSLYMISSSVFALFIVSLPDQRPFQALRAARGLVKGRRWSVLRKLLFLPFGLLVVALLIMLPFIIFWTTVAGWLFFVLSTGSIILILSYMYVLYRELL